MDMLEDDDWMIARINRVSIEDMQSIIARICCWGKGSQTGLTVEC